MSLPDIKSLTDCTDFSKIVAPYVPQLYDLPQRVFQSISDPDALKHIYLSTNPLISAFAFSLFLAPIFFIAAEVNRNYSQVDRFWSLLPTVYNAHFAIYAHARGLSTERIDTLLVLSTLWSIRLTYNYWRKGGYSIGSEDYRWSVLREHINEPLFVIFDLVFIALAQMVLLFSVTTPAYLMVLAANKTQNSELADKILPGALVLALSLAYAADHQQWNYHSAKKGYQESNKVKVPANYYREDLERGFNVTGLWSFSRHPNFVGEQSFWVLLYIWSSWITTTSFNWTIVGAVSYMLLFQASTWLTELISAKKYPEYKEYQQRVGKFLPSLSALTGGPPGDFSDKRAKPENRGISK